MPTATPAVPNLKAALARAAEVRPKAGGFPHLAEALRQAGVTRCAMTVPSNAMLYLTEAGPVAVQGEPLFTGMTDVPLFDRTALLAALRADQAGETAFPEFVRGCWQAGVVRYDVDLSARTCTYYGANEKSYVETYPEVAL
ncbi:DUF1398 domain-containing protein [Streptomyces sp. BV129]|uniref:DUF1398 domain-containing protein n=1 Tax=Streptomyces sp. BV129 TaxID=2849671 RepID=UPI001C2EF22B|nr:DUF1398 family protein [Streptomyces sp. BV129]MBV1946804.1 DUF1398 family protein [Streptomyces sp. BV129]